MGLRIQSSPNLRRSEKWLSGWAGGSWSLLFLPWWPYMKNGGHFLLLSSQGQWEQRRGGSSSSGSRRDLTGCEVGLPKHDRAGALRRHPRSQVSPQAV